MNVNEWVSEEMNEVNTRMWHVNLSCGCQITFECICECDMRMWICESECTVNVDGNVTMKSVTMNDYECE